MSAAPSIEEKYRLDSEFVPAQGSAAYADQEYWDLRFAKEEHKEWLASYGDIKDLVASILAENGMAPKESLRVLLVGVGNSALPQEMVQDGYGHVTATDYSHTVITRMQEKVGTMDGKLDWQVADMLALPASLDTEGPFDLYFDKAAMDAVLADGGDSWSPPDELLEKGRKIMTEAARVLRPSGLYLQLSFGQPHFRKQFLLSEETKHLWSEAGVGKKDVGVGLGYFLYSLQKRRE